MSLEIQCSLVKWAEMAYEDRSPCRCSQEDFCIGLENWNALGALGNTISLLWRGSLRSPEPGSLRWRKRTDTLQPFSDHNSLFHRLAVTLNSGDQCGKGGGPVSSNCWSPFLSLSLAPWLTHTWCIKMSSFLSRTSMVYVPEPVATLGQLPYWLPATVSALEVFPSHFWKVCC